MYSLIFVLSKRKGQGASGVVSRAVCGSGDVGMV